MAVFLVSVCLFTGTQGGFLPFETTFPAGMTRLVIKTALVDNADFAGRDSGRIEIALTVEKSDDRSAALELLCLSYAQTKELLKYANASGVDDGEICCRGDSDCEAGKVAVPRHSAMRVTLYELAESRTATFTASCQCNHTDMLSLVFATCRKDNPALKLTGNLTISNPFGYMSGEEYPYLRLYALLSTVYAGLLVAWLFVLVLYRHSAGGLQKWVITSVILSYALESCASYSEWRTYNASGRHSALLVVATMLLDSWCSCFIRMLLVTVSVGLGVIRATLGPETVRIALFALFYFISNLIYDLLRYFSLHNQASRTAMTTAVLPLAFLNAVCYYWIFSSLADVRRALSAQKQEFKLRIYKRFTTVLVAAGCVAIVFVCVEVFCKATMDREEYWPASWLFESALQLISLVITVALGCLWRPDSNSRLLSQSEEVQSEDEQPTERKEIELARPADYSQELYQRRGPHSFSIDE